MKCHAAIRQRIVRELEADRLSIDHLTGEITPTRMASDEAQQGEGALPGAEDTGQRPNAL